MTPKHLHLLETLAPARDAHGTRLSVEERVEHAAGVIGQLYLTDMERTAARLNDPALTRDEAVARFRAARDRGFYLVNDILGQLADLLAEIEAARVKVRTH